ncbi:MAG: HflK protein [Candidatus Cloacimonetes bacterium 4572_55]|nr:MAG: HflK protein [Candidatus Cloacimonetes bacterium 4572_55]
MNNNEFDYREVGIVLRFGEYVRTAEPGLNFKIPFGVEDVYKVPIQRQLKQEFGYRTEKAGIKSTYSRGNFEQESLMLTGDLNTAEVEWSVQYRISDPYKYLFKVRGQHQTMRMMNESIMREVVGDRTVNEVLTIGRQEVASMVEVKLQELCDQYDTGFKVDQVVLQDVNPPDKVKPSFNAVNEAQQERERLINEARAKYNQIIPKAKGEAKQLVQQAEGYALDRVNSARGDSAKFVDVLDEYKKAPEVTRQRIYLETLNRILPKAGRKVIIDKDAANVIPLLQLDSNSYSNSSDKGRQK